MGLAAVSAAHLDLDLSLIVATGGLNAAGDVMTVGQIAEKQGLCRAASALWLAAARQAVRSSPSWSALRRWSAKSGSASAAASSQRPSAWAPRTRFRRLTGSSPPWPA